MIKKYVSILFYLVITNFFLLFSQVRAAQLPTNITTCIIDTELFPLWRKPGDEALDEPGLNIELYNIILNKLKLQATWVRAPFSRCLILLQNGEVDVINAVSYQTAREKFGRYPFKNEKIDIQKRLKFDSYHAFVHVTDDAQWLNGDFIQLSNKPVAIETGASVKSLLNKLNIQVLELPHPEHAFGMLEKQRVAAVITNSNNGNKYASAVIKKLPESVQNKPYYLMISNQFYDEYTELAERIWMESKNLHISTYQRIVGKYNTAEPW
jgi:polar amino acid transport system substrate-binding protein